MKEMIIMFIGGVPLKIKEFIYSLSIRKKILVAMLLLSIIPLMILTIFTANSVYKDTYRELIDNRKMSINWLADRLELIVSKYMTQFYEFEVNKTLKNDILSWAEIEGNLDFIAQQRIRTAFYTAISIDSKMNSIELLNLNTGKSFVALRSGTIVNEKQMENVFSGEREDELQTNLFFMRVDHEILVMHRINRFDTKAPRALMMIHMKPEVFGEILDKIKTSDDETVVVLNDADQIIQMNKGEGESPSSKVIISLLDEMKNSPNQFIEADGHFYFYSSVSDGKLQVIKIVPNHVLVNTIVKTLLIGLLIAMLNIIVAIFFSFIFSNIISKPIIRLSNKMQTLTLDSRNNTKTVKRDDEIGILHTSFNEMVKRNQKLLFQDYQSKIEARDAQIRALQAQINPHFMYNTLQVIGGMALEKSVQEIYSITLALSDIMRYSLNFSKEMVPLREEIIYLNSYLFIQNQRFGNRLHVKQSIDDSLMDTLVPKLIVQPIIENCLKHGFQDKAGDWNISISTEVMNENDFFLTIEDNGQGISRECLESIQAELKLGTVKAMNAASNIGLNNVNSRIKLYHGEQYCLSVKSSEGKGAVITLFMKMIRKDGGSNAL
jgi:two-component system, sensor histidine kinase YesM